MSAGAEKRARDTVSTTTIESLWRLAREARGRRQAYAERLERRLVEQRFITATEFEDLLLAYGISWRSHELPFERLSACAEVPLTWCYGRPTRRGGGTVGFQALAIMDAIATLILLERLGLPLDLRPLVDRVWPTLDACKVLGASELEVYWYPKCRGKWPPKCLRTGSQGNAGATRVEHHRTDAGYRLSLWRDASGAAVSLEARAPRHRTPREQRLVVCPDCGLEYLQGDVDSTDAHRREHRLRMRFLRPAPHPRFAAVAHDAPYLVRVTTTSPAWQHREMYERARAFRREFKYDFTQWGSATGDDDAMVQGFLFVLPDARIAGACSFRWREWSNAPSRWGLQWIWFAPGHRRSGLLRTFWPSFREEFGDFLVESPVSDAMMAFLASTGDLRLVE